MPPRKRLLLSAYCEAVAKKVARGEAVPAPELANALKEAQEHLASSLHLRDTNEWRMCLALLSAATETAAPPPFTNKIAVPGFRSPQLLVSLSHDVPLSAADLSRPPRAAPSPRGRWSPGRL